MEAASDPEHTLCELTLSQLVCYRVLTPLVLGGGLAASLIIIVFNPLEDAGVPDWMNHLGFRLVAGLLILGYMIWLSSRVGESHAWVKAGNGTLRMKSLWTGKIRIRPLADIQRMNVIRYDGRFFGCRIRFKDGQHLVLEGRMEPDVRAALDSMELFRSSQN